MLCVCVRFGEERDAFCFCFVCRPRALKYLCRLTPFASRAGWLDRKERGQSLVCSFCDRLSTMWWECSLPKRWILVGNSLGRSSRVLVIICVWNSGRALSSWDWAHLLLFCLRSADWRRVTKSRSAERSREREDTWLWSKIGRGLDSGLFRKELSAACERGRIIYFLDRSLEFIELMNHLTNSENWWQRG
jgi:hypothetical protein